MEVEILQQIIDMDKVAAARAYTAIENERRLSDESGEQAAKESREILEAERKKVREYCEKKEQQLASKLKEAASVQNEKCRHLDDSFNSMRDEWKAEIISRITGA